MSTVLVRQGEGPAGQQPLSHKHHNYPSYRNHTPHPGEPLLKSVRQLAESVDDLPKGRPKLTAYDH
ncbi:hypothetical protein FHS29_005520 [Saccharothrix tamanrassetensis]|uniref:Uncharacterized protein n=1 Tax=Saccharothrix tamanrassetensis TaxID=1051531 RepID=A0A841CMR7_9PSEU|nr:hypothetical protein [Saccharothrix tamanrassetensis]MBB5958911.1 hypothetical protein [Saccharothrix tamanrassetensis]